RGRPGTAQLLEDLAALALALRGGGEDPALALALVLAAALVRSGHVARALTRALVDAEAPHLGKVVSFRGHLVGGRVVGDGRGRRAVVGRRARGLVLAAPGQEQRGRGEGEGGGSRRTRSHGPRSYSVGWQVKQPTSPSPVW